MTEKESITKISQLHGETAQCPATTTGKTLRTGSEKIAQKQLLTV